MAKNQSSVQLSTFPAGFTSFQTCHAKSNFSMYIRVSLVKPKLCVCIVFRKKKEKISPVSICTREHLFFVCSLDCQICVFAATACLSPPSFPISGRLTLKLSSRHKRRLCTPAIKFITLYPFNKPCRLDRRECTPIYHANQKCQYGGCQ